MSIKIYGNLTVTGNCAVSAVCSCSSSNDSNSALVTAIDPNHPQPAENLLVENTPPQQDRSTPVAQPPTDNLGTPRRRTPRYNPGTPRRRSPRNNPGTPHRRLSRNNLVSPRRRSSRIARLAELRHQPMRLQRRPLPPAYENHDTWTKIRTLPVNLLPYLSPGWVPHWTTRDLLQQIIWHFEPTQRIPCRTLKAEIIDLFEYLVVDQYGAYYGI
ncbi:uncharacterized protein MELLADRAFT_106645 [Melampsora larici-populina 98AG31]|uniref:Uncharacterized protein n=1 Tax=Melampsora larici-populina (strain 98AG31 / pathotype 3-4-7) TaxID=747676 RepID=F4RM63_MELLP|nr:uncharacterized protein MELLADRAFT_106645 [Melampsora larici-populina 98AG31]EGG06523.1 hypothetical protein MELLADRAFT_106645 [Melampsora larici-populina 98AG31]